jgi:hypothetical protein
LNSSVTRSALHTQLFFDEGGGCRLSNLHTFEVVSAGPKGGEHQQGKQWAHSNLQFLAIMARCSSQRPLMFKRKGIANRYQFSSCLRLSSMVWGPI